MSYVGKPYPGPVPVAPPREANNQLGTVSLVLGVLSLFMGCPFAIGAMIVGWAGMKREPNGMARAGFILGLVMTIVNAGALLVGLMIFVVFGGLIGLGAYAESQERAREEFSDYPPTSVPTIEIPEPHRFDPYEGMPDPYTPDFPAMPTSMPERMRPPEFEMPEPYIPPPYEPPPMPTFEPPAIPRPPGYRGPSGFAPPMPFGPSGAFPPGMGPPVTVEPDSSP